MMRTLFLIVMSALILGTGYLLLRNGVFLPVSVEIKQEDTLILVGLDHIGPYHEVLPSLEKVEKWATESQLDCRTSFGEYLDDPNIVEAARLKAFVGCVLNNEPNETLPEEFRLSVRAPRRYVKAIFRGSPALGPYKVYGKAQNYIREHSLQLDGSVIELYQREENGDLTTLYLFPVK